MGKWTGKSSISNAVRASTTASASKSVAAADTELWGEPFLTQFSIQILRPKVREENHDKTITKDPNKRDTKENDQLVKEVIEPDARGSGLANRSFLVQFVLQYLFRLRRASPPPKQDYEVKHF